jgi:hypothetical protein
MSELRRTTGLLLSLLIVSCMGLVLLRGRPLFEGFLVTPGPSSRCGVQLGGCETPGTRCMNGCCAPTAQPQMPVSSGLPVFP